MSRGRTAAAATAMVLAAAALLGCRDAAQHVTRLSVKDGQSYSARALFGGAKRICILDDWLSFDDIVAAGKAFADPHDRDAYTRCPKLDVNNPDGENWVAAIRDGQCPIVYSLGRHVRVGGKPFEGDCLDIHNQTIFAKDGFYAELSR